MKILFIIILTAACNISHAQTSDETAIRNAMNLQLTAWNRGDVETFMKTYWNNDSVLFVSDTPVYGWQKTLERYKKSYPDTAAMGKLSFDLLQLKQLSNEYYFVVGAWHLKRSIGDVGGYFTLLFRKIDGKWLIVADHSS